MSDTNSNKIQSQSSKNSSLSNINEPNNYGVHGLISKSKFLPQFAAATLTNIGKGHFSPLPFTNYSLFNEIESEKTNSIFLRGIKINVTVNAKRRKKRHILYQYM
jgi:hypothetical protein